RGSPRSARNAWCRRATSVSATIPVGATGLAQVHELVAQLRHEAGARQVDGARIAIAENGGGLHGIEEAVACVTILSK
ncbi:MAG: hypothetical protein JSV48_08560, partial [Bradyrhizobium sp.]